jgi:hypothetical protein
MPKDTEMPQAEMPQAEEAKDNLLPVDKEQSPPDDTMPLLD